MAKDFDLDAARRATKRISPALDELQEPAITWARDKLPTVRRFRQALARHLTEEDKEFPERWNESAAAQLLAGALFCSPTMVARFLRELRSTLSPGARELAEEFRDEPWRYTTFELRESHPDDLHVCLDHDSLQPFLLHSPSVSTLSRQGCRVFLSLLLDTGACRLCFGGVHYFRSFLSYDFAAFAEAIEPQLFAGQGLSATIGRHPELFLLLSLYSEIPPQVFRGTPLVMCADWHAANEAPRLAHPERLESRTSGHLTQLALSPVHADAPSYPQHWLLFFDAKKRQVMASAMGTARYAELVDAAGPAWGFAPLPRWKAGMTMLVAMKRLLGKAPPGQAYIGRFEEKETGEESPEMEKANALLAEIAKRHNAGVAYSLEELASLHGVEPELARQLERSLREVVQRRGTVHRDSGAPGLAGFAPPPPDTLELFKRTLGDSTLFDLDVSPAIAEELRAAAAEATGAEARGGRRGELRRMVADGRLDLAGMPRFVEEEFLRSFGLPDVTVLTYTLYLLLRVGSERRETAAYTAEVFRTFGQALAEARDVASPDRFTAALGRYLSAVLEPLGLVVTSKGDGGHRVETTPLFRKWIRLSGYWE